MDRDKEIEQLRNEIKVAEQDVEAREREVGKRLRELGVRTSRSEALTGELAHVEKLLATLEEYRSDGRKIQERVELAEQVRQQIKANEDRVTEANSQIAARHEELGRVAYEAYLKCPEGEREKYKEVFAEALAVDEKIQKIQEQIDAIEQERAKKGFFGRTLDLRKLGPLTIQKSWTGRGRDDAHAKAGTKLITLDFHRAVPDERLNAIMSAVETAQLSVRSGQEETASLHAKEVQIQEELHKLGVADGKPKARLEEIDKLCAKSQAELEALEGECGRTWYQEGLIDETKDEALGKLYGMITDLFAQTTSKGRQIERLKALDGMDALEKKAADLRAKKAESEEKIRQISADIMEWEHDIEEIATKQEELRKIAESK